MRVYRNVCTYIWNDDKFPFVSDDCQLVWFHLFTNPLSSPLGVYRASVAGLAEDKNRNGFWPIDRYRDAFNDAIRHGFVEHDQKALLIAFPKYFSVNHECNYPTSPNQIRSWGKRFHDLPSSSLKDQCYSNLKAIVDGMAHGMQDAFSNAFGQASLMASPMESAIPDSLYLTPDSLYLTPKPDKESACSVKKPNRVISDEKWITELKINPAYKHIDFECEFGKMDAWFTVPKNRHRHKTKQFILSWLNKIEKPMATTPKKRTLVT